MTFPDDFDFIGVNADPDTQFELNRITRHWKANNATEEEVISAVGIPATGDAHPLFPFMFVVSLSAQESGDKACVLSVQYMGCIRHVDDQPTLPAARHVNGSAPASASTNTDSLIFPGIVTNPATVHYHSCFNSVTYISNPAQIGSVQPDDPPTVTSLISWDLGFGLQPGYSYPALVAFLLNDAFVQQVVESPVQVEEIVPGQFYRVTQRKTRNLFPYAPPS